MPQLGQAALAMWWDIAPEIRSEFEDWHSHEHFPERLAIPGFLRGSRWADADGGERFFVMYELESYATLTSPAYAKRLNDPTPWSRKLFPHHRNMVRSQCRVVESYGSAIAGFLLTVRLSPEASGSGAVQAAITEVLQRTPHTRGTTGGHLLRTETPQMPQTAEQKIRGGRDATADWIVLVTGYDVAVLKDLAGTAFAAASHHIRCVEHDLMRLSFAAMPVDLSADA